MDQQDVSRLRRRSAIEGRIARLSEGEIVEALVAVALAVEDAESVTSEQWESVVSSLCAAGLLMPIEDE